jgi:hypothetical protein
MTVLRRGYWVSRKTGSKWFGRYISEGPRAWRSARTRHCGTAKRMRSPWCKRCWDCASAGRTGGRRKLRVKLVERHPELPVPAASTIGEWRRRQGMVGRSPWRWRCPPYTQPFAAVSAANDVWCTDSKACPWPEKGSGFAPATVGGGSVYPDRRAQPLPAALSGGGATGRREYAARSSRRRSRSTACRGR